MKISRRKNFAHHVRHCAFACGFFLLGCGPSEIKPVEIYPEDMCSQCRMAVSDHAFASEIVTATGEVFKFDDLGCLNGFKAKTPDLDIAATFVKDFETKHWLPLERSTILKTGISTPMGSGLVAFADSVQAQEYLKKFPVHE
ncbi:nitrous oxide reductase accessory protein NosL [candidate division KSB1 bacterium]|nr:nitrous oxide reductase accessory protein NosL [candidate division KSB1 bacterium]